MNEHLNWHKKKNPFIRNPCIAVYGSTVLSFDLGRFFSYLILYTVDRTPWTGDQPVAGTLPTHRTTQTQNKRAQISMPWVGFEPTILACERARAVHTLDSVATVIGYHVCLRTEYIYCLYSIRIVKTFLFVIWNIHVVCTFSGRLLMLCGYYSSTLFVQSIQPRFRHQLLVPKNMVYHVRFKIDVQEERGFRLFSLHVISWISILKLNKFQLFLWNGFFILRIFLGSATRFEPWPLLILEFSKHHSLLGRDSEKGAEADRSSLFAQKRADTCACPHTRFHTSWQLSLVYA
jgi:hypothetical protein